MAVLLLSPPFPGLSEEPLHSMALLCVTESCLLYTRRKRNSRSQTNQCHDTEQSKKVEDLHLLDTGMMGASSRAGSLPSGLQHSAAKTVWSPAPGSQKKPCCSCHVWEWWCENSPGAQGRDSTFRTSLYKTTPHSKPEWCLLGSCPQTWQPQLFLPDIMDINAPFSIIWCGSPLSHADACS